MRRSAPACPRRAAVVWAAALVARPLATPAISLRELSQPDNALAQWVDGDELRTNDNAPGWANALSCANAGERQRVALKDFAREGKYVVLWFHPEEGGLGVADGRNVVEAKGFEALRDEFAMLDAVVVGCSSMPAEATARLCATAGLTSPMLRDPGLEVAGAWGARTALGATARQTFIIDVAGRVRWIERNVEGIGAFSVENHAARVQRELFQVHNADGWAV